MEPKGILTIFLVVNHSYFDKGDAFVKVRVFREECTLSQAKGLIADYKGMNPGMHGNIHSTWCQRVYL